MARVRVEMKEEKVDTDAGYMRWHGKGRHRCWIHAMARAVLMVLSMMTGKPFYLLVKLLEFLLVSFLVFLIVLWDVLSLLLVTIVVSFLLPVLDGDDARLWLTSEGGSTPSPKTAKTRVVVAIIHG